MARRCLNTEAQRHRARSCTVPDASRVAGAGKVRLGDVCKIIGGGTPSKSNASFYTGNIPWASVRDMKEKVLSCTEYCISDVAVENSATNIIPQGEVVISTHLGLGKVCVLAQDTAINQDLKAIIPVEELNRDYLYHWFVSQARFIISHGHGITVKGVSVDFVKSMKIPLPPLPTQRRIAAELDRLCALKKNAEDRLAILDQIVKSRFVEMFGDLVVNDKGWGLVVLGNVCDVRDGTHASPKYYDDGYPLMTSKNFTNGVVDFAGARLISKTDFDEINRRSRVDMGDIVMPMIGTIGHPVIISTNREFAIKNVALIKFTSESPLNVFVKHVLESNCFQRTVEGVNRGNTQKFIALGDIRGFRFPLPPLSLQREFAAFVAEVDKSKLTLRETVVTLDQLYRAKLQKYFG